MKQKVKVVAVSYLNTIPFIYGIEKSGVLEDSIDLQLEFPSKCADMLKSGKVDLGLIPVAEIPNIPNAKIVSDFCIGAEGKVNTVMLYSHCPIEEIDSIALDYQSRTSAMLTKVLASEYWKIDVEFKQTQEGYVDLIQGVNAGLVIGDRAFELNGKFPYQYDLSEEWCKFTGLPFVFACWVANKPLNDGFLSQFNKAIENGLLKKDAAVKLWSEKENSSIDLKSYLNKDISYDFDGDKKLALDKFLNSISAL